MTEDLTDYQRSMNSKMIKPDVDMTDDGYEFDKKKDVDKQMAEDCEIQEELSARKLYAMIDGLSLESCVAATSVEKVKLMFCLARDIIDRQAKELKAKDETLTKQSGVIYARDNEIGRLKDKINAKDAAIGLLDSMVKGGESHSNQSRKIIEQALTGKD